VTVGDHDTAPGDLADDPEACLEFLLDHEVLVEREGELATSLAFEDVRAVYHDSYVDVDEAEFRETVADLFGLTESTAAERIEEHGVTREELVAFLSLRSFLEVELPPPALGVAAGIVVEATPESPVPASMVELDDDSYRRFVDDEGDAVVFVWQRHCDPCRTVKRVLDDLRAATPEGVEMAGVDGEAVTDFREAFDVEAAPTILLFADGELAARYRGWRSVDAYREAVADVYG
jgi:thiol-disulfide isomerase/thioredoxin